MRFTAFVIGKCVKDSKGRRSKTHSIPACGSGFILYKRQTVTKKSFHFHFFAFFCFKANQQCDVSHSYLLFNLLRKSIGEISHNNYSTESQPLIFIYEQIWSAATNECTRRCDDI